MASTYTVDRGLAGLSHYRVLRVQEVCAGGKPDGISGPLILAVGLREAPLADGPKANTEGGLMRDASGKWVHQTNPALQDVGWLQISRHYNSVALSHMPGVAVNTWGPVVPGKTAMDTGFVPRFEEALQFTLLEFHEAMAFAADHGITRIVDQVRFAVAAHNAGLGGALKGWKAGNVDQETANGDYSADVLATRTLVNAWLFDPKHTHWRYSA